MDDFLLDPIMIAIYVHHDDRDMLNAWMESPDDTQIVFLGLYSRDSPDERKLLRGGEIPRTKEADSCRTSQLGS